MAEAAHPLDPLETARLRLRRPRPDDADAILGHMTNFNVARMLSGPPWPYGRADAETFIAIARAGAPDDPAWTRVVADRESDALMGGVGARVSGDRHSVGYWLGEPYWGRGLMTEAVVALLSHRFEVWPDAPVFCGVFADNPASRRILEKLGFEVVAPCRISCQSRGGDVESFEMRASRASFLARATRNG